MKYLITENQQKKLRGVISDLLKFKFAESSLVCSIDVYEVPEEEKDYEFEEDLKYDIFVSLNKSKVNTSYGMRIGTEIRIKKYLADWFGLEENEFSISVFVKEC